MPKYGMAQRPAPPRPVPQPAPLPTFKFVDNQLSIEWEGPRPERVVVPTRLLDALVVQINLGHKAIAAIDALRRKAEAKAGASATTGVQSPD